MGALPDRGEGVFLEFVPRNAVDAEEFVGDLQPVGLEVPRVAADARRLLRHGKLIAARSQVLPGRQAVGDVHGRGDDPRDLPLFVPLEGHRPVPEPAPLAARVPEAILDLDPAGLLPLLKAADTVQQSRKVVGVDPAQDILGVRLSVLSRVAPEASDGRV